MGFSNFIQKEYLQIEETNSKNLVASYQSKAKDLIDSNLTLNKNSPYLSEFKGIFEKLSGFNENEFYNFVMGISQSTTFTKVVFNKKFKPREQVKIQQQLLIKYFKNQKVLQQLEECIIDKKNNPSPTRGFTQLPFTLNNKPIYFYLIPTSQTINHTEAQTRLNKANLYLDKGYVIFDDCAEGNLGRLSNTNIVTDNNSSNLSKLYTVDSFIKLITE